MVKKISEKEFRQEQKKEYASLIFPHSGVVRVI